MPEAMLEVCNVKKSFGGLKAVDGVSMSLPRGGITLLIGPNGSGKTTFVNSITGFLHPDGGHVYLEGKEITGWPMYRICKEGMVRSFQLPAPFGGLSILGNLLAACECGPGESLLWSPFKDMWRTKERENVREAFAVARAMELTSYWDAPMAETSTGHIKLTEIGRALLAGAKLVILDEPICGVDPVMADEVFSFLVRLRDEQDLTFLVIEHRLDIALKYADYVYVMNQGTLIAQGSVDEVLNNRQVKEVYLGS
ncbi:MAG: ABC transporter ATP-binding protein [Thermovirgaceae bacterium]|jgi:branched-chain amino acid transport system ATP-binding protein|nr:ABC transporter ATP-binding protein [Synergistales bacterium]MDI9392285.1 ABC transporter ATP-binding protein [Synergistota bacterium]MDY0179257.1 ABC transporter ATP-binding protein [Synergistaceae bacterium]MDD3830885.1 ABC transporter ATP-binding protein [Synergistales bacterium]MDD4023655.1 ABC transporter ATP-binding protein [Synergistales bacterium]